jgi:hydrogenase/urease accessory protein HupE
VTVDRLDDGAQPAHRFGRRRAALVAVGFAAAAAALPAHDPGLSSLKVDVVGTTVRAELRLASADFTVLGPPAPLDAAAAGGLRAAADGAAIVWTSTISRRDPDGDVAICYVGACPSGAREVELTVPLLAALPRGHRQFATVTDGERMLAEALLAAGAAPLRARLGRAGAGPAPAASLLAHVRLGTAHVMTGYDHLLFLLALLLAMASWRHALAIVTAFTLAHSATLALGTLDLVDLPTAWVECAIAASVAVAGADNLLRSRPRARVGGAFAFGLVHGLGFAHCLRELGVGAGAEVARPLLGFSLGVELGQLALVLLLLPALGLLRRRARRFADGLTTFLSTGVVLCGLLWLLQRWP